ERDGKHAWIERLGDRRGCTKAVQEARQREEQHEAVQRGNRQGRQQFAPDRDVAAEDQREERERDEQDVEHGRDCCRRSATLTVASPVCWTSDTPMRLLRRRFL